MRRTVRIFAQQGPVERLAAAVAAMPPPVQHTLALVASRDDLPLASGAWHDDAGGCLVANAMACVGVPGDARTLDLQMLDAFPEMSSRDLNTLIVAWDQASAQAAVDDDAGLRDLLCRALRRAGVPLLDDAGTDPRPADRHPDAVERRPGITGGRTDRRPAGATERIGAGAVRR